MCDAQKLRDFEGIIFYKIEYFSKDGNIIADKSERFLGDSSIVYIKKGNYKQIYPDSYVNNEIYLYKSNECYTMYNDTDTILVSNRSITDETILSFGKVDSSITILGYDCKCYKIKTSMSENTFFYAESLFKESKYFEEHKHFGYDLYAKDTQSIYLKLIISNDRMIIVFTATKIIEEKINNKVFEIPAKPIKRI